MKKILVFTSLIGSLLFLNTSDVFSEQITYASKTNGPVFYGTKKVIIDKDDYFNINDAKYRVLARDYEDGDIKVKVISNNVNTSKIGTYEVKYEAIDSDNNKTTFITSVEVKEKNDNADTIVRKMYNNASTWNTQLQGIIRGDNQDRQMLGIILKPEQKIEAKVLKGSNIRISVVTNDSWKDGDTVTLDKNEYKTITTDNPNEEHDSKSDPDVTAVPFAYTPMNTQNEGNKKQEIEIEYKIPDDVESVSYYHYGDDEKAFFNNWKNNNTNDYAIIDGNALTVLVPEMDREKLVNYWKKHFNTLDKFLEYYDKVRTNYDKMLGLSLYPKQLLHQETATKYFVRANAHGAGAAYYGNDHVGINNQSVASFFEPNWGGLHELGHGYQGTLRGNSEFPLGEVSNNIFGYFTQIDSNIYNWGDRYLNIDKSQDEINQKRIEEQKDFNQYNVTEALYILVNLLDSFEEPKEVYAQINMWYRQWLKDGKQIDAQDAWVRAIADYQHINILPYFDAWKIPVSDDTREYVTNLDNIDTGMILSDVVPKNQLLEISKKLNKRPYSLITTSELKKLNLLGTLTINLDNSSYEASKGKVLLIKNGNDIVKRIKIDKASIKTELPVGGYQILLPTIDENHIFDISDVLVKANQNVETNVSYRLQSQKVTLPADEFKILGGFYDTNGFVAKTNTVTGLVDITLGAADLGNQNPNDSQKDTVASSVTFIDGKTNEKIKEYKVKFGKNQYYCYITDENGNRVPNSQSIEVKIGDKMVVHHFKPNRLRFYNGYDGKEDTDNINSNQMDSTYIMTSYGWCLSTRSIKDFEQDAYNRYSTIIKNKIEKAQKEIPEDKIENRFALSKQKNELIYLYKQLHIEDQKIYKDYIDRLIQGGKPKVSLNTQSNKIKDGKIILDQNETPDWYSLIKIVDNEDGEYTSDNTNTSVSKVDTSNPGITKVIFKVKDSDQNETSLSIPCEIKKEEVNNSEKPIYHKDEAYVSIIKNNYALWNDLEFNKKRNHTKNIDKQTVRMKCYYSHPNGSTYASLYDKNDKWLGYVNQNAIERQKTAGGKYYSVKQYATIIKSTYTLWNDFNFKKKKGSTSSLNNKTVYVKGEYHHFNGSTYASLYDKNDKWLGYVNQNAIEYQKTAGGKYYSVKRYATIIKSTYTLWNDFNFKKKKGSTSSLNNKTVYVKGEYHHFNGSTYASLYDKNDKWLGYVNNQALKYK